MDTEDRKLQMQNIDASRDDAREFFIDRGKNVDSFAPTKSENLADEFSTRIETVSNTPELDRKSRMERLSDREEQEGFHDEYWDLPISTIHERLSKTKDKKEATSCLVVLITKGLLHFDDPVFLQTLNRFQEAEKCKIPEDLNTPLPNFIEKVFSALSQFLPEKYLKEYKADWKKANKQAFQATQLEFKSYESEPQTRTKILSEMLQNWKKGKNLRDIDPGRYEGFLMNAFKYDKLNSFSTLESEERFYFLILGATVKNPSGQSLLSRDIFEKFATEFIADCGELEFFTDKTSWKKDGKIVKPNSRGAEQRAWNYTDYLKWGEMLGSRKRSFSPNKFLIKRFFDENILKSPDVQVRLKKLQEDRDNRILPAA